jgi:hypothetical protein
LINLRKGLSLLHCGRGFDALMAEAPAGIRKLDSDPQRDSIDHRPDPGGAPKEIAERRTRGGILIPATVEAEAKRAIWGEMIVIGPMVRSAETGDLVLFGPDSA